MSLFSKFTKSHQNTDKSIYPWSGRKITGSHHALSRFGHGATMLDNHHFIVFGGIYTKGNTKKNLFIIDTNNLAATSLTTSGDIPSYRTFGTISSIGGFVLLYGGEPLVPGEMWDPYFYVLHTNTRQWSRVRTKGKLPSERAGHSTCVSKKGIMYIWGGHYQRKYLNDLCAFNVKEYPAKADWEFISYKNQGPSARSGHVSFIHDNKLYIFGGVNASQLYNDIWYFDLDTQLWYPIAAVGYIPLPRESAGAALVDDTLYIFGGRGVNGTLGDLCAYRIHSKRWYTFENMGNPPTPRYGATLTLVQNKIYVFGGESMTTGKSDDTTQVYILDCLTAHAMETNTSHHHAPPRPPRDGVSLNPFDSFQKEKSNLVREIAARDLVISEMKKKEQWWRTEVSLARHERGDHNTQEDEDVMLMTFHDVPSDKRLLFQQLVQLKAEIKRIRMGMSKDRQVLEIEHGETIRHVALEEAAYYKAKYVALKSMNGQSLAKLESERISVLEKRLADAYTEKSQNEKLLQRVRVQSENDRAARLLAEERAKDAQSQSEEAQVAHQTSLEKLSVLYEQIIKGEAQGRSDALVIADLSNQIAKNLTMPSTDVSHIHIEMSRLEVANIKLRNEMAVLTGKLEQSKDVEMNLRSLLQEREVAHQEALLELEKSCIELQVLKGAGHHDTTV
ncbi:uncharacterized protein EV154DRAFT_482260 [Mucor mucedo]|uniref:uncharacterized protein n=1 Tax=Mucor mucedo TaxID=29922 RepID=UPI00221ECE80|nr:uncharacterized protein EV154DRAFT_482260 [Mucor mucedo]KAI7890421.1 hypothetical protein EV154DRAFT_482260 [Mucor mucedo]